MSTSEHELAEYIRRTERKIAAAQRSKTHKRTPKKKQTHYVAHSDVHDQNDSARQVDTVDDIDRDSELPTTWRRPSMLDAPQARPGYVLKWVRYRAGNAEDTDNLEKRMSEGWRPVRKSTVKRVHELTADLHGKYGQYIVKRGLILMELPEKLHAQRMAAYQEKLARMTESIDRNLFKENDPRMPLLKPVRKTRVTTRASRGNLAASIPDDE
jgi:hypothetical protein